MAYLQASLSRLHLTPQVAGSIVHKSVRSSATNCSKHATLPRAPGGTVTRTSIRQFHRGRCPNASYQYNAQPRPIKNPRPNMNRDPYRKANVVVVGTMAVCAGIYLYSSQIVNGVKQNSAFARVTHAKSTRITIRDFYDNMLVSRRNLDEGRWWTLVTHTLTHTLGWHLGINMMSLWSLGRPVVAFFGTPMYAFTWLATGTSSALFSAYWPDIKRAARRHGLISAPATRTFDTDRPALGASGSICGMLGLLTAVFPKHYGMSTAMFSAFSVYCFQNDVLPTIGHLDHLAGIASGIVIGVVLRGRYGLGFRL